MLVNLLNVMQTQALRHSVRQRLIFIEQCLYWQGRLNKADLIKHFLVSLPQATADVGHYQEIAPGNMAYHAGERAFVASPTFKPVLMEPDARAYLGQLLLLADGAISGSESWLGTILAHAAIPKVRRRMKPEILRSVVLAIQSRRALEIVYQSLSSPDPSKRWVAPHALAFDGFRWHARVWCYNRSGFIDLVLARFLHVGESRPAEIDGRLDREWNEMIVVKLAPHPCLPEPQRRAIELDYGMEDGVTEVPMRLSLFYYFERQLCLDIDAAPERQQVVVVNRATIAAALERCRTQK